MKKLYILILLSCFSCAEKTKEKKETDKSSAETIQQVVQSPNVKAEDAKGNSVEYTIEDISGEYELIVGKTHIIDDESTEIFKAAIVIERLSETDFGFYSADKRKDFTPLGNHGVLRRMNNSFHELKICDGEDVEGYTEGNFTTGLYLYNEVVVYKRGDVLGLVHYGSNFRKYMLYKKKKSKADFYISLVKTMKNTKEEHQEYLNEYEVAKNYNTSKLRVKHNLNDDEWLTKHFHNEDYASFENTHFYQNSHQEGKFIKHDAAFENQFKNQVESAASNNEALENLSFEEVIHSIDTRPLPRIDGTNFDDFIEAED